MRTASSTLPHPPSRSAYHKARHFLALELETSGTVLTAASNHPLVVERQGPKGIERGFELRLHQDNPSAPLSPYYLQFRTPDNPKPGPLTPDIVDRSASCMQMLVAIDGLDFDAVVGVPNAGKPFAEALARFTGKPLVEMAKYEHSGKRHIASLKGKVPPSIQKVLVVDDLITAATSKLEAITILQNEGIAVDDVVVLVDREEGGYDELDEWGCRLHSVFTITELFDLFVETGRVPSQLRDDVQTYRTLQS